MENLKSTIRKYIVKELNVVAKPKHPNQNYSFNDLSTLIDLLFSLLEVKIQEKSLQRVSENFYTHIQKILDFNESELPIAIEGLATNFESYLKLIAYLKYGDTDLWHPDDEHCAGLSHTMLYNLLSGKISNKHSAPPEIPLKDIPEPLLNYRGIQRSIYDFVRTELRNAVHNAKSYTRLELMHYSNLVLSCYLFVVEDNSLYLKKKFNTEFLYLNKVFKDKIFEDLDKVYVDLLGHEEFKDIEVLGSELFDEIDILDTVSGYKELHDEQSEIIEESIKERRIDSIIKIANDTKHLHIIGQPGSGKTTTLLKILYNQSKLILNGDITQKIPFYINAYEFHAENTFMDMMSSYFSQERVIEKLKLGNFQILIDGLNEISGKYKKEAYKEIKYFLSEFDQNSIILSERKINFENRFKIPVFELKDLNETQVHEFIKNYSGNYFDEIWNQLKQNEDMLHLAYSPLMLKMILSVSKSGVIPQNRGLLYQVFINSIFNREKVKLEQIRTDTKKDVLAHIAYEMRRSGNVSLSNSQFKRVLAQRLKYLNSSVSLNILFNELHDNLIVKTSHDENVSFYHETYQEYFCAVRLKEIYETTGSFEFSFKDDSWFEALQMCSELIKDNDRAISLFNYIFRGQKKTNTQKSLFSFDESDFNKNINIACKIAYSTKSLRPDIYNIAVISLTNYLVLWKYFYFEKNKMVIPIEDLFASVASLNSNKIINYIINSFGWANIWLYSEYEEKNNTSFFLKYPDNTKTQQMSRIVDAIIINTPYFGNFYDIITESLKEYQFSKSILWRLKKLKQKLLKSQSENNLRKYFNSNPDFEIFLSMLINDVNTIIEYSFPENSVKNNSEVLELLIKFHGNKEIAQNIILPELLKFEYDDSLLEIFSEKLFKKNQIEILFNLLEGFLENKIKIKEKDVVKLQTIPYSSLTDKLKDEFTQIVKPTLIPYKEILDSKLLINSKYKKSLIPNKVYTLNKEFDIEINNILPKLSKGQPTFILKNVNIDDRTPLPKQGTITLKNAKETFKFQYLDCHKYSIKKSLWEFTLLDFDEEWYRNCKEWIPDFFSNIKNQWFVNNSKSWRFSQKGTEMLENKEVFYVQFKSLFSFKSDIEIPESGFISLSSVTLDIKSPLKYHPTIIVSDSKIMSFLKNNLKSLEYSKFIRKLGITKYFHKEMTKVHYGIIANKYENIIVVYSLLDFAFHEYWIYYDDISRYTIERIVVIENDYKINLLNEKDEKMDKIGYLRSEIVHLDQNRREGHIKKVDYENKWIFDYYFHFKSCDFIPENGDFVKFIPAINPSRKYENQPMAFKISKISRNKCKVIFVNLNNTEGYGYGKAVDIITEELLFFQIKLEKNQYIQNLDSPIEEGHIFEYSIIKEKKEELLKTIKLIKLTPPLQ